MDEPASGPSGGMLALTLSYDGTAFAGSQLQSGQRSVQGELLQALAKLGQPEIRTTFAGRTDRGVHAVGQVVSLPDPWPGRPPEMVRRSINAFLPDDVGVREVRRPGPAFHARFDATWRQYRYMIGQESHQPVGRPYVWFRPGSPLDVAAMRLAASEFVGRRDCASLAGAGQGVPWSDARQRPRGTTRTVFQVSVEPVAPWWAPGDVGGGIAIEVTADGFLPQMVRTIVAMLVRVGRGNRDVDWVRRVLAAGDRRHGTPTAPAHGLTLWRVEYGDDPPWSSDNAAT